MKNSLLAALVLCLFACPKPGSDLDPKIIADGHYLSGQAAYLKGDFEEAHKQYAEVRKLNPTDPRLNVAEGEVFLSEVKVDDAIASFEAAVKVDPKRGTTWSRLGYLYSLKRERTKAHDALEKALAANPRDYNALESLAELQLEEGKPKEALDNLTKAADYAPDTTKADLVLRLAGELEKQGRGDEVLTLLEASANKGLKSAVVFGEMGDRMVKAGRLEDAAKAYQSAAKIDTKDPAYFEMAGEVLAKLGKPAEAEAAFKSSLAVQDRGVVHVALARLCQAKKDDACLTAEIDKALDKSTGEEVRETLDLAELLYSVNRKKDALELYRSVSEEGDQKGNIELHLRTARLAKELNDEVNLKAACTRALASGQAGLKCP
ncbi:MAG: acetylglucosamine transferase [Archangium gephyra]|uniref:Acetylglucosamine transferase n=1 Tax=Archangium gephyra TaxID=48 RepID=A0A2W5VTI0_9BACT|nr:MAG: acetylglucosamine transferase [Archangium gephyra]